jgi:hypothetical protein
MTPTQEQIEDALAAFALASGLGIFPDEENDEEWREDLVNGMRAAIAAAIAAWPGVHIVAAGVVSPETLILPLTKEDAQ